MFEYLNAMSLEMEHGERNVFQKLFFWGRISVGIYNCELYIHFPLSMYIVIKILLYNKYYLLLALLQTLSPISTHMYMWIQEIII